MKSESSFRPRIERGTHLGEPVEFGRSVLGNRLEFWPADSGNTDLLVMAGIHGEESDTTVILSKALRSLKSPPENAAVITCANPDGLSRGTRGNANGVDLNRNFPAENWSPEPTTHYWTIDLETSDVALSPGKSPGSEPETRALIELVENVKPAQIVALHGPLGCIDDPAESDLGRWISEKSELPLVTEIGYPTPGSFGSWCVERGIPIVTWEFPPDGIEPMFHTMTPILVELLSAVPIRKID